ncbi:valine--tRNA ligase [Phyllobacterium phragmitis]|uniref:Valine--tRNA ligase n=1 Tax=Phyllobacterium phragmitis TaxID=2670329 RepID=A0ABQ0GZ45_9HYPH
MLEKTYDAAAIEPKIAELWEKAGAFKAGAGAKPGADPFSIVIPPPNVTGSLHMGHALNNTIQDILVRFERMRGKNVLWQPGMDHAGIATQMVVERQLMERQEPNRHVMGREKFVERIWQWKAESGGMIANQLRRLGASCDWSRERFTMDEGLSKAVLEVFVTLYKQGLIYKDKRLVNWDPKLLTAISDIEVESREVKGHLWHFRYPLENVPFDPENPHTYIVVATTRPETMLGDTGVAVNPNDPRYHALVGNDVVLPLVGRHIPIVADDYADPEAGSGAVKITPAHDFNDFEVGRRHDLPQINILTTEAAITLKNNKDFLEGLERSSHLDQLIRELDGLDRFAARKRIVEMMEEGGYLERIEDHTHAVPHGDRGGVPIEPFLTDQWYVNAAELAKPAIAAVREDRTKIIPANWEKTYFDWMENIQPWCVSRQLWWGHQIPAWYGPDGTCFVERTEDDAKAAARAHYGEDVTLTRDSDVLDTWFSSALWPFSTFGWPDRTPELATYYPTSVLVTGFDIIFFWVARMMMMGLHFMEKEPFHTVYLHALVRDKNGAKMSKSKGNVLDPLELIDEYGADALRFTLAIMAAQGRDVKLDPARIAGYRNFGTKLWNATRFAGMNGVKRDDSFDPAQAKLAVNRWILTELTRAARAVTDGITTYKFNEAAGAAYKFVWNQFCDWYLELLKPIFMGEDEAAKKEAQACAAYCLDEIYKLLHPFMPFMTEELWAHTAREGQTRPTLLAHAEWPVLDFEDGDAAADINWLIELVTGIRSVRAEMNVPPSALAPLVVLDAGDATRDRLERHDAAIKRLARVETIGFATEAPKASAQIVIGEATVCLPLGQLIDIKAEAARLTKEAGKIAGEIERIEKKLANEKFVANAREEVVEAEREKLNEFREAAEKTAVALRRIESAQ